MEENKPDISKPYPATSSGEAITRFFKKYATFSGRASRSEYWKAWIILLVIVPALLAQIDNRVIHAGNAKPLYMIWNLITLIPAFSLTFRRLHDSNLKAGWLLLPPFIGFVGLVTAFVGIQDASDKMGYKEIPSDDANKLAEVIKSAANSSTMWTGIGIIVLSGIIGLYLYCRKSRPEGVRFDK